MPRYFRPALWLLTFALFAHDFYLWGGLRDTRGVGTALISEAKLGAPYAATYLTVGSKLNGLLGLTTKARENAEKRFPEFVAHPEKLEYLAVRQILDAQDGWGRFCYWFAPVCLVLSLVAHRFRQKQIRSFGTKG